MNRSVLTAADTSIDLAAPALFTPEGVISHAELGARVDELTTRLGTRRQLVAIEAANRVESVVAWLAALRSGHPVLFTTPCTVDDLRATYAPGMLLGSDTGWELADSGAAPLDLHPELALLMSTSGSTGSPKLVRLSRSGVLHNANAIAESLRLRPTDVAITSLPMQYCYGLSVLNSHLAVGGAVALSEHSVIDVDFWALAEDVGCTTLAGVPHTFELLESAGRAERLPASLRLITQAGGRMPPERVRSWAQRGQQFGFDFTVMYGQTEATARMAVLPADLAADRPECIGVPIPGGSLRIDPVAGHGRAVECPASSACRSGCEGGELVYAGPNVMLGYAECPQDLARGREVFELRTGDLAKQHEDGIFEIIGRLSRFAKVLGLRVDLDRLERLLAERGHDVRIVSDDDRVQVFVAESDALVAKTVADLANLPAHLVRVHEVPDFPRTASGKCDYAALAELATLSAEPASVETVEDSSSVAAMYSLVLNRRVVSDDDTFITLRGDSLSFVEVSLRLEELIGDLPADWPSRTVGELEALRSTRRTPRRWRSVETATLLRGIAITLVVATHAGLTDLKGGAHALLAVAGWNVARFLLVDESAPQRSSRLLRAAAVIAVPAIVWISAVALLDHRYDWPAALLVNQWSTPHAVGGGFTDNWEFWFLELVVWTFVALAVLFSIPGMHRLERARPLGFAVTILGGALAVRYLVVGVEADALQRYTLHTALWFFVLGWVAARCTARWHRWLLALLAPLVIIGFFGQPPREATVTLAIWALLFIPHVRLPRAVVKVLAPIASATFFIYLTHFVVYAPFKPHLPLVGTVLSLLVGVLVHRAWLVGMPLARSAGGAVVGSLRRVRPATPSPRP